MAPRRIHKGQLAQGMGWFSIALGVFELTAPRTLGKLIGARTNPALMRWLGAREILSGVGLLLGRARPWFAARVAGDAMDLGLLGYAFSSPDSNRGRLTAATAAVAGVTIADAFCTREFSLEGRAAELGVEVKKTVTIGRPPHEVYQTWRDFEGLPRFMKHLHSVRSTGGNRSHWVAKGPAGAVVEWDAEVTGDTPDALIAWRSLPGGDVDSRGVVRFEHAQGERGTIVRVQMQYRPVGGFFGAKIAKLLGQSPETQVAIDLLRFKQFLETGEIARTEGQPAGRPRSTSRKFDDLVRA